MHAATRAQTNLGDVNDVGGKRGAHIAMRLPGVVQEAGLQRDEAIAAQADLRSSRAEGQSRRSTWTEGPGSHLAAAAVRMQGLLGCLPLRG